MASTDPKELTRDDLAKSVSCSLSSRFLLLPAKSASRPTKRV